MARTEVVTITNMCMVYHGDKVLVQDKIGDDKWNGITFLGGHVEKGEPLTDAIIREVLEETGLTIFNPILGRGSKIIVSFIREHYEFFLSFDNVKVVE